MGIKWIAQIFGIFAMISLFCSYQQTERKKLIMGKLCADVFWVAHYLCLGAYAGMISNCVGIFREIIFLNRDSKKWASSVLWPVLFVLISWGLGMRTFESPINILPIVASTFATVSFWFRNPRLTKIISAPASSSFLIYDIVIGSYAGVLNESIVIGSIILSLVKEYIKGKKRG